MAEDLKKSALEYHQAPKPGKLEIKATKPLATQRDLALAYSPGVAAPCEEIARDPLTAMDYTARGNLVAVVTNGTAVLGLGAIGALASKPVMEGKAVLFKKFADIDVFDIEVDERDPQAFIDTVARLEPTFGGINLEDIKAPECFEIERGLRERLNIPVFHDDQHGTAIVVCAAVRNGLRVVDKKIDGVRVVTAGAGAAALACLDLLVAMGLPRENVLVCDLHGVVYEGREEGMDPYKARFANRTDARTLADALTGADVFLGLSAGGVLKAEWLPRMASDPLILALANPTPEILPEEALAVRPDAILATGRSDYPNQVNNVLCFPFLFRGALDVSASEINQEMKLACVEAIANLALEQLPDIVRSAYGGQRLHFGRDYLIPKPFDPRLIARVAPAVARAATNSGVALRPLPDLWKYRLDLESHVFRTGLTMKPLFERAAADPRRIVFAEGEEEKVLETVSQIVEQGIAEPILVGRRAVVLRKLEELDIRLTEGEQFRIVDPQDNPRHEEYCRTFFSRVERKGYSPTEARAFVRTNSTVLAALMVHLGEADALICGSIGRFRRHIRAIAEVIGLAPGVQKLTSLNALVLPERTLFIADTYVQTNPTAAELAEIVRLCAEEVRWFGIQPKVALLSHSNFGSHTDASAKKMRDALELIRERDPYLEIEGEMHANLALSEKHRSERFPNSRLKGAANLLIAPSQDAANIAFNLMRSLNEVTAIGPILLGAAKSAHLVTPSTSVRGLLNMTAVAVVRAQSMEAAAE